MPQVIYAPGALRDLERLREFLRPKNPAVAVRPAETIRKAIQIIGRQPQIGRSVEGMPDEYREWLIDFGDSGY
jgi:plasmid stabilization system protein ParE